MKEDHYKRGASFWLAWVAVGLFLVALVLHVKPPERLSIRPTVTIETNGVARLGIIPLQNKTVRELTLKAVAHVQSSTVSLAVAESARFSKVADMLDAMTQAGITSVVLRTERSSTRR